MSKSFSWIKITIALALIAGIAYFSCPLWHKQDIIRVRTEGPKTSIIANGKINPQEIFLVFDRDMIPDDVINGIVTQYVTLSPNVPGEWRWFTKTSLGFTPFQDWAPNTQYTVTLDQQFLEKGEAIESLSFSITTPPFTVNVQDVQTVFTNSDTYQMMATMFFTHPVDIADLRDHLEITVGEQSIDFVLEPAHFDRVVYISSSQIPNAWGQENATTITLKHAKNLYDGTDIRAGFTITEPPIMIGK